MYRSMMQVNVKNSVQAVSFYQNAFDAKLLCDHRNEDGTTIYHAELDVFGQVLVITELSEEETITGNSMQFCLHFGEGKEDFVKTVIERLSEGGRFHYHGPTEWSPLMAGIIDKFGVNWCVFV